MSCENWYKVVETHLEKEPREEEKQSEKRLKIKVNVDSRQRISHLYYIFLKDNSTLSLFSEGQWVSIGENFTYGSI